MLIRPEHTYDAVAIWPYLWVYGMKVDEARRKIEAEIHQAHELAEARAIELRDAVVDGIKLGIAKGSKAVSVNLEPDNTRRLHEQGRLSLLKRELEVATVELTQMVRDSLDTLSFWPHRLGVEHRSFTDGMCILPNGDSVPPAAFAGVVDIPVIQHISSILSRYGYTHPMPPRMWTEETFKKVTAYTTQVRALRGLHSKLKEHDDSVRHRNVADLWDEA
ncbi:hypothetical protein [Myxococcus sp. NMCA1]|uniref:hypothetical protein n=1 Tax=Myxococcus sp. NMCA1 TaxID=2996785 RepID=UPI0022855289|nr:hypothetical protein [Myxococcus sp. NMCA1]WAM23817.1 hypothetical protein OZ403_25080 [Myxococcus sp. NMCA1]